MYPKPTFVKEVLVWMEQHVRGHDTSQLLPACHFLESLSRKPQSLHLVALSDASIYVEMLAFNRIAIIVVSLLRNIAASGSFKHFLLHGTLCLQMQTNIFRIFREFNSYDFATSSNLHLIWIFWNDLFLPLVPSLRFTESCSHVRFLSLRRQSLCIANWGFWVLLRRLLHPDPLLLHQVRAYWDCVPCWGNVTSAPPSPGFILFRAK